MKVKRHLFGLILITCVVFISGCISSEKYQDTSIESNDLVNQKIIERGYVYVALYDKFFYDINESKEKATSNGYCVEIEKTEECSGCEFGINFSRESVNCNTTELGSANNWVALGNDSFHLIKNIDDYYLRITCPIPAYYVVYDSIPEGMCRFETYFKYDTTEDIVGQSFSQILKDIAISQDNIYLEFNKTDEYKPIFNESWRDCDTDEKCIEVPADCCGCTGGGGQTAINKKYYDIWENELNKSSCMCLAVMSCQNGTPKCIENKCQFILT